MYIQGDSECESHKARSARNTDRKRGRQEIIHTRHRLRDNVVYWKTNGKINNDLK